MRKHAIQKSRDRPGNLSFIHVTFDDDSARLIISVRTKLLVRAIKSSKRLHKNSSDSELISIIFDSAVNKLEAGEEDEYSDCCPW